MNRVILVFTAFIFSSTAIGHSDHHHTQKKSISEDVAKAKAKKSISNLIKAKKIDASWEKSKQVSIEKKKFGEKFEWLVIFENNSLKDKSKKKLYVFLKLSGDFIAANHTGK